MLQRYAYAVYLAGLGLAWACGGGRTVAEAMDAAQRQWRAAWGGKRWDRLRIESTYGDLDAPIRVSYHDVNGDMLGTAAGQLFLMGTVVAEAYLRAESLLADAGISATRRQEVLDRMNYTIQMPDMRRPATPLYLVGEGPETLGQAYIRLRPSTGGAGHPDLTHTAGTNIPRRKRSHASTMPNYWHRATPDQGARPAG